MLNDLESAVNEQFWESIPTDLSSELPLPAFLLEPKNLQKPLDLQGVIDAWFESGRPTTSQYGYVGLLFCA